MTIRLARHDEIVERMARHIFDNPSDDSGTTFEAWDEVGDSTKRAYKHYATAALDALLTAVVELGVGQQGGGADIGAGWVASSSEDSPLCNDGDFTALILQLEDKT